MAGVSSRRHGGIPKLQRIVNPFDSDKDDYEPTMSFIGSQSGVSNSSSSSWSAQRSTRYTNPFDHDTKPHSPTKSKIVAVDNHRVAKSWNPFDDDDSSSKLSKDVAKVNKVKSSYSNQSTSRHDTSKPFNEDYEDTFKPKTRGDTILDEGSIFDNEPSTARLVKERKSATWSLRAKIVEGRSRMKEIASRSLSSVKLPTLSSSSGAKGQGAHAKMEFKGIGKSKYQESMELFGESSPTYLSTQHNYFSQEDQRSFTTQTMEELEQYAVKTSQETMESLKTAITILEDTKGVATTTLETFHNQGEQFRRTHLFVLRKSLAEVKSCWEGWGVSSA